MSATINVHEYLYKPMDALLYAIRDKEMKLFKNSCQSSNAM